MLAGGCSLSWSMAAAWCWSRKTSAWMRRRSVSIAVARRMRHKSEASDHRLGGQPMAQGAPGPELALLGARAGDSGRVLPVGRDLASDVVVAGSRGPSGLS